MSNETVFYSAPRRLFHWIIAILMIAGIILVEIHEIFPRNIRGLMMNAHFQAGLLIFILAWPRIALALSKGKPPVHPPLAAWEAKLSVVVHGLLYLAMIAMPVLGLLGVQAGEEGKNTVMLLGWQLPQFVSTDKGLHDTLLEIHEVFGNAIIGLVLLHIAGAIWHHGFRKDDTLTRMLSPRTK
jgi:cytochrome b561